MSTTALTPALHAVHAQIVIVVHHPDRLRRPPVRLGAVERDRLRSSNRHPDDLDPPVALIEGVMPMKVSALVLATTGLMLLPTARMSAEGVNDAQIASIVVTANQVDIDAGELASSRSTNEDVKTFARLMVTDHTGVNKAATDLAAKLKVTPEDNPTSKSLKDDGAKSLAHLNTLNGLAFDKAYIDREVAYHGQMIDALDNTLIPGATNEELKALLVKVRPAFVAHFEHAKRLQASQKR
jgi:putative membrane protein